MKLHLQLLIISLATIQNTRTMDLAPESELSACQQLERGSQSVYHAFRERKQKAIEAYIQKAHDVTQPIMYFDEDDCNCYTQTTLLDLASKNNLPSIIMQLRARGVNIAQLDERGNTPLARAIGNKELDQSTLIALVSDKTINYQNTYNKSSPLHILLYQQEVNCLTLDFLCEQGASLELQDSRGNTPIHYAVSKDSTGKLLNIMLRTIPETDTVPSFVNIQNKQGATPLHLAIEQYLDAPDGADDINSIQCLLELGADFSIRNIEGLTPADLYKRLLVQNDQQAKRLDQFLKSYYEPTLWEDVKDVLNIFTFTKEEDSEVF